MFQPEGPLSMTKKALLKKTPDEIDDKDVTTRAEQESIELLDAISKAEEELHPFYDEITSSEAPEQYEDAVNARLRSYKRASSNIFKAYKRTVSISGELSARWNDLMKSRKKRIIPAPPSNAVIDLAESNSEHFAQGLSIYKLMLLCYFGSFVGVIIETLWCLLTRGYIESRAGLVYGPFNLLYGTAAVALTVALYRFRNKSRWISFFVGMLVGSIVEYACSWGQELIFGSRSWDYSHMPFNLNGRICLLYAVFWGILSALWVKSLYPRIAKLILKIPNRAGKIFTWIFAAFFVFNAVVTVLAVFRWSQRIDLIEPSNAFWKFIDLRFPDERMGRIFANMNFG